MNYENKLIAFIDILGFSDFVEKQRFSLDKLLEFTAILKKGNEEGRICPESNFIKPDLNYNVTQISDCLIITTEISELGLLEIINNACSSLSKLMREGIMCRGYISKGLVYHKNSQIIGPAYQHVLDKEKSEIKAFQKNEDKYSTPFVEVDPAVKEIVTTSKDKCIKKQFRYLTESNDNFTVLSPFSYLYRLAEASVSSTLYNTRKAKKYIQDVRNYIQKFKNQLNANIHKAEPKAKKKAEYYLDFLDDQLKKCNELEQLI